jgi:AhpD family alkylhydroperoxidase
LLRGDSPFSAAERELIGAYVSGLNGCNYCHAIHSQTAIALGIRTATIAHVFSNSRNEHLDLRMQPVLDFVHKLTLSRDMIAPYMTPRLSAVYST